MKVRNGFVSNSSSSSFILKVTDEYPDVFTLAKKMLQVRLGYYKEHFDDNEPNEETELIKLLETSDKDRNTPVTFFSCSFDTFIVREGSFFFIDTCNNYRWREHFDAKLFVYDNQVPERILRMVGECESNYWNEYYSYPCDGSDIGYRFDYWQLDTNTDGVHKSFAYCDKCHTTLFYKDEKIYCIHCKEYIEE